MNLLSSMLNLSNLIPFEEISLWNIFLSQQIILLTRVGRWGACNLKYSRGGRTQLPKFKFSAKFPIGLHVILQNTDKKKSQMTPILCEKLF